MGRCTCISNSDTNIHTPARRGHNRILFEVSNVGHTVDTLMMWVGQNACFVIGGMVIGVLVLALITGSFIEKSKLKREAQKKAEPLIMELSSQVNQLHTDAHHPGVDPDTRQKVQKLYDAQVYCECQERKMFPQWIKIERWIKKVKAAYPILRARVDAQIARANGPPIPPLPPDLPVPKPVSTL